VTSTPTTTQIPGDVGEKVDLTCIVNGKPSPSLFWKRDVNDIIVLRPSPGDKVNSITTETDTSIMEVTVSSIGEKFYCIAVNLLGSDNQQYTIRQRGMLTVSLFGRVPFEYAMELIIVIGPSGVQFRE